MIKAMADRRRGRNRSAALTPWPHYFFLVYLAPPQPKGVFLRNLERHRLMCKLNAFLLAVAVSLAIVAAGLAHALVQCPPYALDAKVGQQSQPGLFAAANESPTPAKSGGSANCQLRAQHAEEELTESWAVFGYRLKVTDTLVAAFTALLFFATGGLWLATRSLVKGADKNAEMQLRAYVFISKTHLEHDGAGWKLSFKIKNFGQTPAHNVKVTSKSEAVSWNNGKPVLSAPDETDNVGSMPGGDVFQIESQVQRLTTVAELEEKDKSKTKAIYLVGTITYSTVFAKQCCAKFRYYVGGDNPYSPGSMNADSTGNDEVSEAKTG
jgi:hypothetical protein